MQSFSPYDKFFTQSISGATPPPAPDVINTNFGIYYAPLKDKFNVMVSRTSVYSELQTYNFRGIRSRYWWPELEGDTINSWTFTPILDDLADLQAANTASGKSMKMIIMLALGRSMLNADIAYAHVVPLYMRDNPTSGTYQGGEWQYSEAGGTRGGYRLRAWNANVKARMIALVTELKAQIQANGYYGLIEGIGFTESAIGGSISVTVDANGYFAALRDCQASMRALYTTKMVFQYLNYPQNQLETSMNASITNRAAIGGPDVFPDEPDLQTVDNTPPLTSRGLYEWMYALDGSVVKIVEVQPQDYQKTVSPSLYGNFTKAPGQHVPTIQELYDFGTVNLHVNYLVFTRASEINSGETLKNYERMLAFMDTAASPQKTVLTGGCNTAAPTGYNP